MQASVKYLEKYIPGMVTKSALHLYHVMMNATVFYGDKLAVNVTKELKQLVNISVAAGKFIVLHPNYELIREAMRLELFEETLLDDFEIHNSQYETGEIISYDAEEVFFFYCLIDLSCRIFLCDAGDDLKKMAIQKGETTEEQFNHVRSFFLHQAEGFLQTIREQFSKHEAFQQLHHKMEQLNSIA